MAKTQQKTIPVPDYDPRLAELLALVQEGRAFSPPSMTKAQDIANQSEEAILNLVGQDVSTIPSGIPGIPDDTPSRQALLDNVICNLNNVYQEITGIPFQDPGGSFGVPPPTRAAPSALYYPINPPAAYDPLNGGYQASPPINGGLTNFMEHQLKVLPDLLGFIIQGAQAGQLRTPGIPNPCAILDEIVGAVTGFINDLLNQLLTAIKPILDAINQGLIAVLGLIGAVFAFIFDILNRIAQFILDQIAALVSLFGDLSESLGIESLIAFLNHPCTNFMFQQVSNGGITTSDMANVLSSLSPGAIQ
jgi:hypothetical protein